MLAETRLSMQAGPEQIAEDHNDAWQGMCKLLLGSDEQAQAAGLPSAPTDISSSSLLHKLQSMRIIHNPESCSAAAAAAAAAAAVTNHAEGS